MHLDWKGHCKDLLYSFLLYYFIGLNYEDSSELCYELPSIEKKKILKIIVQVFVLLIFLFLSLSHFT